MVYDEFYKNNCIFEEENVVDFSDYDNERLRITKDLYEHISDFIDVFENIGESSNSEVKDILFKKVKGKDVMEFKINHVMGTLYSIFTKQRIMVQDNDLHNSSDDCGNPDILLNNTLYLEGKRLSLGYSKFNKKYGITDNSKYTICDLEHEVERFISKYKKRSKRPNVLSIFVPMYMSDFIAPESLLNHLSNIFSKYINVYNSNCLFNDICFFINFENIKHTETKGKLLFISLNREICQFIQYSITNIIVRSDIEKDKISPKLILEFNIYNKWSSIELLKLEELKRNHLSVLMFNQDEVNNSIYSYGDMLLSYGYAKTKMENEMLEAYNILNNCGAIDNSDRKIIFKLISSILCDKDNIGYTKIRFEKFAELKK